MFGFDYRSFQNLTGPDVTGLQVEKKETLTQWTVLRSLAQKRKTTRPRW